MDRRAPVVVIAVAGADAFPVGLGGWALVAAELLELGEEPVLGGVDPGDLGREPGVLAGAGGGVLGGGDRDPVFEHRGPVVPEDVLVQERGDAGDEGVFADGNRRRGVVRARGGRGGGWRPCTGTGSRRTPRRRNAVTPSLLVGEGVGPETRHGRTE